MLQEYAHWRQTELDFRKIAEARSTTVSTYYPELIERLSSDEQVAKRIIEVHLSGNLSSPRYSHLMRLPNVEKIEIMYSSDVDKIVPTVNRMTSLKTAAFAYCDPSDSWLPELNNASLRGLHLHGYQRSFFNASLVASCQTNMPNCTITVTSD